MCANLTNQVRSIAKVTTAVAMGENLTSRLVDAGISFSVIDQNAAVESK